MDVITAVDLLRPAITVGPATWADIGAGSGVFTLALATILGPDSTVYALDRDANAVRGLRALSRSTEPNVARIVGLRGDLSELPELPPLDGAFLGNVLHYIPAATQAETLRQLASTLAENGRLVIAEYDDRPANPWVPHPVSIARLGELAETSGFTSPVIVAAQPSAYGGTLYVARMDRR
jgi:ubiquinone/menaquinone biosynthesis C-methylase UbiE